MKAMALAAAVLLVGCGGGADPQGGREEQALQVGAEPAQPSGGEVQGPVGGYLMSGTSRRWVTCPKGSYATAGSCSGGSLVSVAWQGVDPDRNAWACVFVVAEATPGQPWAYSDQEADVSAWCE